LSQLRAAGSGNKDYAPKDEQHQQAKVYVVSPGAGLFAFHEAQPPDEQNHEHCEQHQHRQWLR
jgi:hypothetical protein